MGSPLRQWMGDRSHLSPLEKNTPKDPYKLVKLLYKKIKIQYTIYFSLDSSFFWCYHHCCSNDTTTITGLREVRLLKPNVFDVVSIVFGLYISTKLLKTSISIFLEIPNWLHRYCHILSVKHSPLEIIIVLSRLLSWIIWPKKIQVTEW